MVVLQTEYSRGGRNAATVRMKLKSLLSNSGTEVVYKTDDKMDQIILDKKVHLLPALADPMYVFMDAGTNQFEVEAGENQWDNMPVEVVFLDRQRSVESCVRRRYWRSHHGTHGRTGDEAGDGRAPVSDRARRRHKLCSSKRRQDQFREIVIDKIRARTIARYRKRV